MTDTKSIAEFLNYAQPNLMLNSLASPEVSAWQKLYKWRKMKAIADGDVATKEEHEEHVYEGDMNPRDLGTWLLQWDDRWRVWTSDDNELWITRYVTRFLSRAEIEEAVKYIEQNPEPPEQEPVKWREQQALRTNFSTEDWT